MAVWTSMAARMGKAILALAALALALIPAADAAACGPEPLLAVAKARVDGGMPAVSDAEPAPDRSGAHGDDACVHGHCHHQGQSVAPPLGEQASVWSPSAVARAITADRAPPGGGPGPLQRPPRA